MIQGKQRDIFYADLEPVKGREQGGYRPVLIISGDTMNDNLDVVIVCPLSTSIKQFENCIVLGKNKQNGLKKDSEVITFQVKAIAKDRLVNKIGTITPLELNQIKLDLADILEH